tara:strand:- start:3276 stop:4037 length:762 start_codon:yes stop_codon:yes gene_type:complete
MPQIPEIGIRTIEVPEIPAWQSIPPQSIPNAPPITLQLGFPIAEIPGCVETRNTQPGNPEIYENDPRGTLVVCDGTMPSYRPLDFTPGTLTYGTLKPPAVDGDTKKSADVANQPTNPLPLVPGEATNVPNLDTILPCPPPDAIPLGAKNKSQTAVIVGYKMVDGKCETEYEPLPLPAIVSNYLPGAPVVVTTTAIAAAATTSAIMVKPLGDYLLKIIKPAVKQTIKKIKKRFGRAGEIESVFERRQNQRMLRQ